ncbi:MAG: MFS transporter [bacterium]
MKKEKNIKTLLSIVGFFTLASALSDVFVNIYIWKLKESFMLLTLYMVSGYIVIPFVFYLAGLWGQKTDRLNIYKLGIYFYILFYIVVLLLNKDITHPFNLVLLGLIKGLGMGFYFFGLHILIFDYTSTENRDKFYANMSILSGASALVAPFAAGYITFSVPDFKGYYIIFIASVIFFLISSILSSGLKSGPIKTTYKVASLIFGGSKQWRGTMWAYFWLAAKDTISLFLVGILVYKSTGSEFSFGKYALIVSVITICSSYIIGKFSKPHKRASYVLIGSFLYLLATLALMIKIEFSTLLIYGIIAGVADYLIRIPLSAHAFDTIALDMNAHEKKMEYIVARDVPIAIGRIFILGLFVLFIQYFPVGGIKAIMLLITAAPFAIYFSIYKK